MLIRRGTCQTFAIAGLIAFLNTVAPLRAQDWSIECRFTNSTLIARSSQIYNYQINRSDLTRLPTGSILGLILTNQLVEENFVYYVDTELEEESAPETHVVTLSSGPIYVYSRAIVATSENLPIDCRILGSVVRTPISINREHPWQLVAGATRYNTPRSSAFLMSLREVHSVRISRGNLEPAGFPTMVGIIVDHRELRYRDLIEGDLNKGLLIPRGRNLDDLYLLQVGTDVVIEGSDFSLYTLNPPQHDADVLAGTHAIASGTYNILR